VPDGYTYTTLGQSIGTASSIVIGSYIGTGLYGSGNPCSITADRPIKELILLAKADYTYSTYPMTSEMSNMVSSALSETWQTQRGLGYYDGNYGKKSADGKTFYWYGSSADRQDNDSSAIYYYMMIL